MGSRQLRTRLFPYGLRALVGGAGAAGLAVLGLGLASGPAVLAATPSMTPLQLLGVTGSSASGTTTAAASSPCWQSSNWSGYMVTTAASAGCTPATGVTYSSVSGNWTVPAVTAPPKSGLLGGLLGGGSSYSALWTGIDGVNDTNLIQSGTEEDVVGGTPTYGAWWEILPAPETVIPSITVRPGDAVSVTIGKGAAPCTSGQWLIAVTDSTADTQGRGSPFTTCQSYSGQQTSAEWVVEAPLVNGMQSSIANYGSALFDKGTVNGASVALVPSEGGELTASSGLLGLHTTVKSTPSPPDTGAPAGDGFACAYGSTAPPAPSS
ncbi:MAG: hypothetical protein KGJ77_08285 [Acidobacteriota bacterium]|nr:hypothetical protein [Acidobacteriota bacterium]